MHTPTSFRLLGVVCMMLFSVQVSAQFVNPGQFGGERTLWDFYMQAGQDAYDRGDYDIAETHWLTALKEAESFGPQDPRLGTSLDRVATLHQAQGNYAEAEPLYKRSLAIREKTLGPEHPNVAQVLENYAGLLRETNREDEAAKMEARAQAIRAKYAPHSAIE